MFNLISLPDILLPKETLGPPCIYTLFQMLGIIIGQRIVFMIRNHSDISNTFLHTTERTKVTSTTDLANKYESEKNIQRLSLCIRCASGNGATKCA